MDDDGYNGNGGVDDDDGGVDINDGNDANGGHSMNKTDCNDDADGGGGNSNDDIMMMGMVFLRIGVLIWKMVMRLVMVTSKLRVLQVTLLIVMEVLPK